VRLGERDSRLVNTRTGDAQLLDSERTIRLRMRKGSEESNAIPEILKGLESRLEAYVNEWQRERGIHKGSGVRIVRKKSRRRDNGDK
jgi:hypothetical protein